MTELIAQCRGCTNAELIFMMRDDGELFILCIECETVYPGATHYESSPQFGLETVRWTYRPATREEVLAAGIAPAAVREDEDLAGWQPAG